jgi:hypothetical protein
MEHGDPAMGRKRSLHYKRPTSCSASRARFGWMALPESLIVFKTAGILWANRRCFLICVKIFETYLGYQAR